MSKNKIKILSVIIVLLLTAVFGIQTFGAKIELEKNSSRVEELTEEIIEGKNNKPLTKEEIIKKSNEKDLRKMLKAKGYYADDINISLSKYAQAAVIYDMTENEFELILSLMNLDYDFEKLIDIYNFLKLTDKDVSCMQKIYDIGIKNSDSDFWIENAYESYINEENPLTIEDVYYYTDSGISIEEILACYEMSLIGKENIHNMLDSKVEGKSWYEIAKRTYDLPETEKCDEVTMNEIRSAVAVARRNGETLKETVGEKGKFKIKKEALDKMNKKNDRLKEVKKELKVLKQNDEEILKEAEKEIKNIEKEEIKQLLNDGYRIREIKNASEGKDKNNKRIMEIESKIKKGGER